MIYYLRAFESMDYDRKIFRYLFFNPHDDNVIAVFREWVSGYEYAGMKVEWDNDWEIKCS